MTKDEQLKLAKDLFDMVYQWGRAGIVTNERCDAFQDKLKKLLALSQLEEKEGKDSLQLADHNFRINSDGWKKITVDDKKCLVNPTEDVWELWDGEQLFTWKAAMRETKKAGKRMPTDEEFEQLLKTKADMPNLVLAGYRYTGGLFSDQGTNAYFWSSVESGADAWYRGLYLSFATVSRDAGDQVYGFSVRCLDSSI